MPDKDVRRFGTFLRVYTPSVLTILGVMMYLSLSPSLGSAAHYLDDTLYNNPDYVCCRQKR